MATPGDSTSQSQQVPTNKSNMVTIEVHDTGLIDNNPLAASNQGTARTTQQQVIPNAVQNRFFSLIQQWPSPVNPQSTSIATDVKIASSIIGVDGHNVTNFAFKFTNSIRQPIFVELCTSLYIDGGNFSNAYPFGGDVVPLDWGIEVIKTANFAPNLDDSNPGYPMNQVWQDSANMIIKLLNPDSGPHQLYVAYYWRSLSNQGGSGGLTGPNFGQ